jgi:hypothetical protein
MRAIHLAAIAFACLSLGSCSNLKNAYDVVTSAQVSPKLVVIAGNAFDAIEPVAEGYIRFCTPKPAPAGCNDTIIQKQLIPAIRSGRVARTNLEQFLTDHPGALGPAGLYDSLTASTATIQQILAEYNVGAAK